MDKLFVIIILFLITSSSLYRKDHHTQFSNDPQQFNPDPLLLRTKVKADSMTLVATGGCCGKSFNRVIVTGNWSIDTTVMLRITFYEKCSGVYSPRYSIEENKVLRYSTIHKQTPEFDLLLREKESLFVKSNMDIHLQLIGEQY